MSVFGAIRKLMYWSVIPLGPLQDRLRIALNDKDHARLLREMEQSQTITGDGTIGIVSKIKVLGIQVCRDNEVPDLEEE